MIKKLPRIPKKKKEKSPVLDSMKDAGPMLRDLSETVEQLMHRVIKIVARVPMGTKRDYEQYQIPPEAYVYYIIIASNEATMAGAWLGFEELKSEADFEFFRQRFNKDYGALKKSKQSCQCLIAQAQILWETTDERGPEDVDQIIRALTDIPAKYWYYGLSKPAFARITHLPKKLCLYWYEGYHGVADELRCWRQMHGPLVDLSGEQYTEFLEEADQKMLQVAGAANQFRQLSENVSYKSNLAHALMTKIERSEWHIDRLAIVNIVLYPLRQLIPARSFLRADDLERVEACHV